MASIIVTLWVAARTGRNGTHDVELIDDPWSATSGGFDGSPALSTCVRPNDVSISDSVSGMGLVASAAS
jgi:hypothetical protein